LEFSRKLFFSSQVCYYVIAPATAAAVCRHIAGSIVYILAAQQRPPTGQRYGHSQIRKKKSFFFLSFDIQKEAHKPEVLYVTLLSVEELSREIFSSFFFLFFCLGCKTV
jgi:hypothetical protein